MTIRSYFRGFRAGSRRSARVIVQKMNEIGHPPPMNQKDIDLVQELEAEEAARAEAVRMEENARLNALKAAKAADGQNGRGSGTRSGDKYRPRKKREPPDAGLLLNVPESDRSASPSAHPDQGGYCAVFARVQRVSMVLVTP
jgi:hypothetical protein